jgi:hypothetical protein
LVKALGDDDALIRKQAAVALKELGNKARHAIPALKKALKDNDTDVRAAAQAALEAIDIPLTAEELADLPVPRVIRALEDGNPLVRERAALALRDRWPKAREAVPALRKLLQDDRPLVRNAARAALSALAWTLKELCEQVRDPKQPEEARRTACQELAERFSKEPGVKQALQDVLTDSIVKVAAAKALDRIARLQGKSFQWRIDHITAAAISPDGNTLAGAVFEQGQGDFVLLWDVVRGKERAKISHPGLVYALAFSDDGRTLASCGQADGQGFTAGSVLTLWDTTMGKVSRNLRAQNSSWKSVAFSGGGKTVVTGGENAKTGTVTFWDTTTGRELSTIREANALFTCVALSANGRMVATGGIFYDFVGVRLWDSTKGKALHMLLTAARPMRR